MNEERAKKVLQDQIEKYGQEYDEEGIDALEMAIKALEQQPYYDCVSRTKVAEILKNNESYFDEVWYCIDLINKVDDLPPVQPRRNKKMWIKTDYWSEGCGMGETYGYYYECPCCGNKVKGDYDKCSYRFCSKCGTEMGG